MPATRVAVSTRQWRAIPLAAALSAAALSCNVDAASLGHTRIVSAPGQPLRIDVPIVRLSAEELRTLQVALAPAASWAQAGLTPPAELSSLRLGMDDGPQPGMRIVHVTSSQAFDRPVADLLLEVRTSSGRQQYQVSVLAPAPRAAAARGAAGRAADGSRIGKPGQGHAAAVRIPVHNGDYLFTLARRHAVPGVTVYQMMVGLLRANPQAFIHANMNLVKAGATLRVPDVSMLTSVSDREARRIFEEQALEFARYRQRLAAAGVAAVPAAAADRGQVTAAASASGKPQSASPRDRLKLSSGAADDARADDAVALRKGIADSQHRISELEGNIGALGQALHGQQGAAGAGHGASAGTAEGGALRASAAGAAGAGLSTGSAGNGSGTSAGSGVSAAGPDGRQGDTAAGGAMLAQSGQAANGGDAAAQQGHAGAAGVAGQAGTGTQPGQAGAVGQSGQEAGAAGASGSGAAGAGQAGAGSSSSASGASSAASAGSGAAGAAAASSGSGTAGTSGSASSGSNAAGAASGSAAHPGGQAGAADAGAAGSATQQTSDKAGLSVSWIQEHMLGVITGLLALIVLIIAWLLRRANIARDDDGDDQPSAITEAMVQAKLDKINLDLSQAPSDEPPATKT
ncbi:hypothetical protein KVP10_00255 [Candidimonas humi]|uniref:FimV family protein n=1 Tax=Candidimonas humi TaxID=683355 RepID=A0ABV8NVP8_9BURK|nr:FimV/HubP family polar landmark protein [Candidimonas humi]MBV6303293.1 hypothetical protein [Candidimonas humi]